VKMGGISVAAERSTGCHVRLTVRGYEAVKKVNRVEEISRESVEHTKQGEETTSMKALCRQRRIIRQSLAVHPNPRILRWGGQPRGGVVVWRPGRNDRVWLRDVPLTLWHRGRGRSWVLIPSGSCNGGFDHIGVVRNGSTSGSDRASAPT